MLRSGRTVKSSPYRSIKMLRRLGPRLLAADLKTRSHDSLDDELREFLFGYQAIGVTRNVGQIWHRARPIKPEKHFTNLHELIYPPTPSEHYGRASLPGSNVMYGAWNMNTACEEVEIEPGQHAQIICYRPLVGVEYKCHVVGEYHRYSSRGESFITDLPAASLKELKRTDPERFAAYAYVDSIISRLFRRKVSEKNNCDYKLTAIYSDIFYDAGGGLIYPSARNPAAANLALRPCDFDSQFEVIGTHVLLVGQSYREDVVRRLRSGVEFFADGTINWNSTLVRPMEHSHKTGWREKTPLPGWRKPSANAHD